MELMCYNSRFENDCTFIDSVIGNKMVATSGWVIIPKNMKLKIFVKNHSDGLTYIYSKLLLLLNILSNACFSHGLHSDQLFSYIKTKYLSQKL